MGVITKGIPRGCQGQWDTYHQFSIKTLLSNKLLRSTKLIAVPGVCCSFMLRIYGCEFCSISLCLSYFSLLVYVCVRMRELCATLCKHVSPIHLEIKQGKSRD